MVGHANTTVTILYNIILIKCPSTVRCPAQTRDLLLLDGKLIVISDFFCGFDVTLGVDDNLLLETKVDNLSVTVGLKKINTMGINKNNMMSTT